MATWGDWLTVVREEYLDDDVIPYRHSTAMLLRMFAEALREACRRGSCELIHTAVRIPMQAGRDNFPLSPSLLKVYRARWKGPDGVEWLIEKTSKESFDAMERLQPGAEEGRPRCFYIRGRTLWLRPMPDQMAVGTGAELWLDAWTLPVEEEALADDEPEIADAHQRALCHWVAYRALSRPSEDTVRADLAALNLSQFNAYFGAPVDASTLEYLLESTGYLQHLAGRSGPRRRWVREFD